MLIGLAGQMYSKNQVVCLGEPDFGYSIKDLLVFCDNIGLKVEIPWNGDVNAGLTAKKFFSWLGFARCISMDYSDYEGAEIIHNLNEPDLAQQYHGLADLIIDAGTLEHVFHLPNALKVIHDLLRPEGMVYHHNPSNGYLDHGFYQICPTLYYDYYRENRYEIVSANLINRYKGALSSEPYLTDVYRNKGMFYSIENLQRCTVAFLARKTTHSTAGVIPTQSYYRQMHSDFRQEYENQVPFSYHVTGLLAKVRFYFPFLKNVKGYFKQAKG